MKRVEDLFKKISPITQKGMDVLWQVYVLSDYKTRRNIEDVMRIMAAKNLDQTYEERDIFLEPPPEDIARGDYFLGFIHYGKEKFYPFFLREEEWLQHAAIFGRSGSGKTNVGFIIVLNFLGHSRPFLIFDWKRNYRDLLSIPISHKEYRSRLDEVLVFTVGRDISPFYFNPLIPPERSPPQIWINKLIDILCHSYFVGEGVAYLLQKCLDSIYQEFGVYDGKPEIYPTMCCLEY